MLPLGRTGAGTADQTRGATADLMSDRGGTDGAGSSAVTAGLEVSSTRAEGRCRRWTGEPAGGGISREG